MSLTSLGFGLTIKMKSKCYDCMRLYLCLNCLLRWRATNKQIIDDMIHAFIKNISNQYLCTYKEGGEKWTVNYTRTQSSILMFSYLLSKYFGYFWLVHPKSWVSKSLTLFYRRVSLVYHNLGFTKTYRPLSHPLRYLLSKFHHSWF